MRIVSTSNCEQFQRYLNKFKVNSFPPNSLVSSQAVSNLFDIRLALNDFLGVQLWLP